MISVQVFVTTLTAAPVDAFKLALTEVGAVSKFPVGWATTSTDKLGTVLCARLVVESAVKLADVDALVSKQLEEHGVIFLSYVIVAEPCSVYIGSGIAPVKEKNIGPYRTPPGVSEP